MISSPSARNNRIGISSAVGASVFFSFTDMSVKLLSGDYALHEIILIRSIIGLTVLVTIIVPLEGGWTVLRTKRLPIHILRGLLVVMANMAFFLGLAAMPLADAVAIFFISPLLITMFSVLFLGETVGPRRWVAVIMGLAGVIIMVRPGSASFQLAALLPLIAAVAYAGIHIITRKIGGTEKAGTLTFYAQIMLLFAAVLMGLTVGDGRFAGNGDPSLDFLLRGWIWPSNGDWWILLLLGVSSTFAVYFINQAYRLCEAGLAAPFEYTAMVLAIFWGVILFGEWPDASAWVGISLIIGGGLFMLWREAVASRTQ
ncbi:MAG: DMT family transporter [Rhodobacteraceae bacterium]|nr:DMT family transporter [Paracoccaceae bacterium]